MREFISDWIYLIGLGMLVIFGWQLLEIVMIGKINPNRVDTVVGLVLTLSLYGNLKKWNKNNS